MRVTVLLLALASAFALSADNAVIAPRAVTGLKPQATSLGTEAITIPQMLSYQGKLTDTLGQPVADTLYAIRFRLYAQPTGGTQFWEENQNVRTTSGLFSTLLGSVAPIGFVPDAGALYLGTAVGGGAELTPRLRIVSSAYAFLAERARRADTADYALTIIPDTIPGSLAIGGELRVYSKARFGYECSNNGDAAFCAGYANGAFGYRSSVSGGEDNSCNGHGSHIGGGTENSTARPWATVGGGILNDADDTASTVAGGWENVARGKYAAIGGGQYNEADSACAAVGGGYVNVARSPYSVVAGGYGNHATGSHSAVGGGNGNEAAGGRAVVAGGYNNIASNFHAVVSGGQRNVAGGQNSVVPGGYWNTANGLASLAAGEYARANHSGSFVWGDANAGPNDTVYTTGNDQFRVRASGGTWFFSNAGMTTGAYLAANANSWAGISYQKDGSAVPVDRYALLERLVTVPVCEYRLDGQDESVRHIGPTAHEYRAALGYGETETGINLADADGVLLAAVQALYEQNQNQQAEIEQLKAELRKR